MNWEQFFKIDWRKIVIVLIGMLLFSIVSFDRQAPSHIHVEIVMFFAFPLFVIFGILNNAGIGSLIIESATFVLYLYLISCLIIWADAKTRKNSKTKGERTMLLAVLMMLVAVMTIILKFLPIQS
jgi:hypothetical protein